MVIRTEGLARRYRHMHLFQQSGRKIDTVFNSTAPEGG